MDYYHEHPIRDKALEVLVPLLKDTEKLPPIRVDFRCDRYERDAGKDDGEGRLPWDDGTL